MKCILETQNNSIVFLLIHFRTYIHYAIEFLQNFLNCACSLRCLVLLPKQNWIVWNFLDYLQIGICYFPMRKSLSELKYKHINPIFVRLTAYWFTVCCIFPQTKPQWDQFLSSPKQFRYRYMGAYRLTHWRTRKCIYVNNKVHICIHSCATTYGKFPTSAAGILFLTTRKPQNYYISKAHSIVFVLIYIQFISLLQFDAIFSI